MLLQLPIQQTTTGDFTFYIPVPYAVRLQNIRLVSGQALAADGTNYLTVSVIAGDGATSLASLTTNDAAEGFVSLVAGEVQDLDISNFDDSNLTAGQAYKVTTVSTGTLANVVDLNLVIEVQADRSY